MSWPQSAKDRGEAMAREYAGFTKAVDAVYARLRQPPVEPERVVRFFAPGIPKPGGSKRAFLHRHTGRIIVAEDCKKSKDWRAVVALSAAEHCRGLFPGPVQVEVIFVLPRPKGHFGKGRNADRLLPSAPEHHTVRPDCTKLWRSTEDALKGISWADDSQVIAQYISKRWGDTPGAHITIRSAEAIGEKAGV